MKTKNKVITNKMKKKIIIGGVGGRCCLEEDDVSGGTIQITDKETLDTLPELEKGKTYRICLICWMKSMGIKFKRSVHNS